MKSGTRTRKVVEITKGAATLSPKVCKGVLGMHAFIGCELWKGKGYERQTKTAVKEALTERAKEWYLPPELAK